MWLAALDLDDRFHVASAALVEAAGDDAAANDVTEGDAANDDPVTLVALDLTLYEVANVAVVSWHSQAHAKRLVELIRLACPATLDRVDEERMHGAAKIATEHNLTVYDAAYVAAAHRQDWTLVSCDLKDLVRPGLAVAPDAVLLSPPPEKGRSQRRQVR